VFTGIIETIGTVREVTAGGPAVHIGVEPGTAEFSAEPGASVSVDGACLTVEFSRGGMLYFTAVRETLSRTTLADLRVGDVVNIERALALSGRLDGHFVLGHVDAVGAIVSDKSDGVALVRTVRVPPDVARFCAEKGSVALDGTSLTITRAAGTEFAVSLVPFTMQRTALARKRPGDRVNVECDVLARYIARLAETGGAAAAGQEPRGSLLDTLERSGF
jgi:riboflavin synthase